MKPSLRISSAYNELLHEISDSLLYREMNSTSRKLLFRPRRAGELAKKPLKVQESTYSEPIEWRGQASSSLLTKLIKSIESPEQWAQAKATVLAYAKHEPGNLRSNHLSSMLRSGHKFGNYTSALTLSDSVPLKSHVGADFYKEALRLKIARYSKKGTIDGKSVTSLFERGSANSPDFADSVDTNILAAAGLAAAEIESQHLAKARSLVDQKQSVESLIAGLSGSKSSFTKARFLQLDLELSLPILQAAGADVASFSVLKDELNTLVGQSSLYPSYMEDVSAGIEAEKLETTKEEEGEQEDTA